MEGLIAVLCEVLAMMVAALVPAIIALVTLVATLVPLIIECGVYLVVGMMAWWRWWRGCAAAPAGTAPVPASVRATAFRRWMRRLVFASAVLATVGVVGCLLMATVFADQVLSWGIERATRGTGYTVTHEFSTSALLRGSATLRGVHIVSQPGAAEACDVTIAEVAMDLRLMALLHGELSIDDARMSGVHGTITVDHDHRAVASPAGVHGGGSATGAAPAGPSSSATPGEAPRQRPWSLAHLEISDVAMDVTVHRHGRTVQGPLVIRSWVTGPITRDDALFDLLFRSTATGAVMGSPFSIANAAHGVAGTSAWHVTGVPVPLLAVTFAGPFSWLADGRVDVAVDNSWDLGPPGKLRMDWRLQGSGLTLVDAGRFDPLQAKLIALLAAYIARYDGMLDLGFAIDADPGNFTGAMSFDAAGLSALMSPIIVQEVAKRLGLNPDQVRAADGLIRDLGTAAWDHWRKRHPAPSSPAASSASAPASASVPSPSP